MQQWIKSLWDTCEFAGGVFKLIHIAKWMCHFKQSIVLFNKVLYSIVLYCELSHHVLLSLKHSALCFYHSSLFINLHLTSSLCTRKTNWDEIPVFNTQHFFFEL